MEKHIAFHGFDLQIPEFTQKQVLGEGQDGTVYKLEKYLIIPSHKNDVPSLTTPLVLKHFHSRFEEYSQYISKVYHDREHFPQHVCIHFSDLIFEKLKAAKVQTYDFYHISQDRNFALAPYIKNSYSEQDFTQGERQTKYLQSNLPLKKYVQQIICDGKRLTKSHLAFTKHAEFIITEEQNNELLDMKVLIGDLGNILPTHVDYTLSAEENTQAYLQSFLFTYSHLVSLESLINGFHELHRCSSVKQWKIFLRPALFRFCEQFLNRKLTITPSDFISHMLLFLDVFHEREPLLETIHSDLIKIDQHVSVMLSGHRKYFQQHYSQQMNTYLYDALWLGNHLINIEYFTHSMSLFFEEKKEILTEFQHMIGIVHTLKEKGWNAYGKKSTE